jgi:hypothetical protein
MWAIANKTEVPANGINKPGNQRTTAANDGGNVKQLKA